jgi:hypothetical protein
MFDSGAPEPRVRSVGGAELRLVKFADVPWVNFGEVQGP